MIAITYLNNTFINHECKGLDSMQSEHQVNKRKNLISVPVRTVLNRP